MLIRARDWAATSLGALEDWPATIKVVIATILRSPLPIVTLWGEDGVMIYNDAYSVFAGGRHPRLLGSKVREGWPEVAEFNDNVVRRVFRRGEALSYKDQVLVLDRGRGPSDVWLDLDYSPVVDEDGAPLGVIAIVVETTERVLTDQQLRDERARLSQIYEQSPSFMALLGGAQHSFEIVNPAYMSLVGDRDLLGRTVAEALPEARGQGYVDLLDEVYRSGQAQRSHNAIYDVPAPSGGPAERRYVDVIFQPIRDRDGRVLGVFVNGVDVTEGTVAQEALRASEARFRAFAEAMPNQAWTATTDGSLDWFNERVGEYSGRDGAALTGHGWFDIIHAEDRADAIARWREGLTAETLYETELRLRRADGEYRWHLVRALPVRGEAGTVERWIGTNTDIHEQKLVEFQSSRDLERIWNLSPVLKMVTTRSGTASSVNPAWTRTLGWTYEETVGRNVLHFVDPESRAAATARLKSLGTAARNTHAVSVMRAKDGGKRRIEWTSVSEDGMIYAFGRDITAEFEATEALRRSESALFQAQKMEAIGQLTGGVAHDFNNLLQVVGGNLQLLATELHGNPQAARRLRNAMEGVSRGARLAAQLLAFGRRQPLAPKVVNLARLVRGMDEILRRALGEAIEIETVISGGLWNTYVDPVNIENALLNLAINARDAMDGLGKLTIEAGNALLDAQYACDHLDVIPGQYVLLAVSDTGCGMPPEVTAKVFEPFFTTKSEDKGTGLGLSMVYGFVKQSGGHIKIYSELGEGTTIKIYLPRSTQVEDEPTRRDPGPVLGGQETILVAEDDEAVRRTVGETLTGLGYTVLQASDATAALAVVESGVRIDLLFSDVVMPGPLKAPDLARKATERLPALKVLFTSGYTENSIVHGGRLDEGVELLSKPYSRETLAHRLRTLLGQEPSEATEAVHPISPPDTHLPGRLLILVCEDDALIRMATVEMIEELGHAVLEAQSGGDALRMVAENAIDILVTDLGLPDMSGAAVISAVRAIAPNMPVIVATGRSSLEGITADDRVRLLPKPFDARALAEAIKALVATTRP
ncbi:MAG: hybrid sensor histidine kinase/response regulator [Rhodovulum sulfidophilum]|uniref:histidine kinase n=1 Tax=Rhodovulum sulfidophilum TaxID=35806 RepID=A0A2W5MWK2_RHOSU|nr:MAG: hybrid sensor histidine kinase/response regulator [Rhodovulum sulfidophilum]